MFAPKENDNDTDCFCDGGRSFAFRGHFRDFAGRADRAHVGRYDAINISGCVPPQGYRGNGKW